MTLHETLAYLRYRNKARGRHGTHSPFVYAFVEDMLRHSPSKDLLMKHILHYFRFNKVGEYQMTPSGESSSIFTFTEDAWKECTLPAVSPLPFSQLYSLTATPHLDKAFFDTYLPLVQADDVMAIKPLHKTAQHTQQWNRVKDHPRVTLSIDMFDIGLLFFREEFKIKQHFVLK
ncbi:MAG: hypothetical protein V4649_04185 [Bacteroidota bacterium]